MIFQKVNHALHNKSLEDKDSEDVQNEIDVLRMIAEQLGMIE